MSEKVKEKPIPLKEIKEQIDAKLAELLADHCKEKETYLSALRPFSEDSRASVSALLTKSEKQIDKIMAEFARTEKMKEYENRYAAMTAICGIDEVGRGPLAGPVVACAVILPKDCDILYLNDSKQLSAKKREELFVQIMERAVAVGTGCVSHEVIDEINILQATFQAMREAIANLSVAPDLLLVDAVHIPEVPCEQVGIIKGDAKSISIAAASIVAKVTRDHMMEVYDAIYPGYGFASNKGYGSAEHLEALRTLGACPIHRKSFIKNLTVKGQRNDVSVPEAPEE